jgi:hypothetical protein
MIRLWDVEWADGTIRTVAAPTAEEAIKKAKKDFPSKPQMQITEVRLAAEEDEPEEAVHMPAGYSSLALLPARRARGGRSHEA